MLVYIAAPLGDPDPVVRAWHRERANLLAALAFAEEGIPVCVHAYAELAIGDDTHPEARERGLRRALDALHEVQYAGGMLWGLKRDDGTLSTGCQYELEEWQGHCSTAEQVNRTTFVDSWSDWRTYAEWHAPHLLPEFDRLAVRP